MAVEKRNPLPPGRYWVDVFDRDRAAFREWLDSYSGVVVVLSTESYDANAGGPARDWYLFHVHGHVAWNGPGYPTIADAQVTSSRDTQQGNEPTPDAVEQLRGALKSARNTSENLFLAAVIGLGVTLYVLNRRPPAARL